MTNDILYRYCDGAETEEPQLVVPRDARKRIMEECYDSPAAGHYGVDRTLCKISAR